MSGYYQVEYKAKKFFFFKFIDLYAASISRSSRKEKKYSDASIERLG